ncbi:MAG: hypothetical protein ACK5P7_04120 [Bdellovibrio sp.]
MGQLFWYCGHSLRVIWGLALCVLISGQVFAQERVPLKFDHQVQSCARHDLIWTDLERALVDSEDSKIWPSQLSSVTGRAQLGAVISVTYGNGWFAPTYTYNLTEYGTGVFRYEARADHPFVGGARVSVLPSADGRGSILKWDGLYLIEANDERGRRYFKSFSANFFAALDSNLKLFESDSCN